MKAGDIHSSKKALQVTFIVILSAIVFASMFFTNRLVNNLSKEEKKRMEILAEATRFLIEDAKEGDDISFVMRVIEMNTTIPVIIIDESDNLVNYRNIEIKKSPKEYFTSERIQEFKSENPPIEIAYSTGERQFFYYGNSSLLLQLSYFPIIQLIIIIVFCAVVLYAILSTKQAEQNQVWVGLSRETAHQLGTPISSLLAWMELLKDTDIDKRYIGEMSKDVSRLGIIAERFSKIGSKPDTEPHNLLQILANAVGYIQNRVSHKVKITYHSEPLSVQLNVPLFEWVIENLCKNAIDAMEGEGVIDIEAHQRGNQVIIDVTDSGKGVSKSKFKTIFIPGYTTKKRGWGLGLSLVKRIVEEYHKGKIFVKSSEIGKGTTFRILLPMKSSEK